MTAANTPRLIEALKKRAGEDGRIACAAAFQIAADLDVPIAEVGRVCSELGIEIVACQLGCF